MRATAWTAAAWTAAATVLAAAAGCGDAGAPSSGSRQTERAARPATQPAAQTDAKALSRARLLISVSGYDGVGPAYVVRGDGTHLRRLYRAAASVRRSPDGRLVGRIVATGRVIGGYYLRRLITERPDGGGRRVLPAPRGRRGTPMTVDEYDWSPDGRRLAVALTDIGSGVFQGSPVPGALIVERRDGRGRHQQSSCETGDGPAWSPDGTRLAYACLFSPLATVGPDGPPAPTPPEREYPDGAAGGTVAWRPDGRQIAYSSGDGTKTWTTLISLDGAPRRRIRDALGFTWSPDGRYCAYVLRGDGSGPAPTRGIVIARASDGRRVRVIRLAQASAIQWYR